MYILAKQLAVRLWVVLSIDLYKPKLKHTESVNTSAACMLHMENLIVPEIKTNKQT
jgi:hypothetical protein